MRKAQARVYPATPASVMFSEYHYLKPSTASSRPRSLQRPCRHTITDEASALLYHQRCAIAIGQTSGRASVKGAMDIIPYPPNASSPLRPTWPCFSRRIVVFVYFIRDLEKSRNAGIFGWLTHTDLDTKTILNANMPVPASQYPEPIIVHFSPLIRLMTTLHDNTEHVR